MNDRSRWRPACIGLGSNLDSPREHVQRAARDLAELPNTRLTHLSSLYVSKPMGPSDQPDYINAVATLVTRLSARGLLAELHKIERHHGRDRASGRWGPRTLDLDLLLFGNKTINDDDLKVPHTGIPDRNFVLLPLCELAPHWVVPGMGSVRSLLSSLAAPCDGIEKLGT